MQKRIAWLIDNGYTDEQGSVRRTRTTSFLMPLIGITEESVMKFHPKIFINAYIEECIDKKIIIVLNKLDLLDLFLRGIPSFARTESADSREPSTQA